MNDIDRFFQDPSTFDENQEKRATLYLLRRDISMCFGINPNNNEPIKYQVLFPGVMAIMAGIDLMAKFYWGSDNSNEGGKRFNGFVKAYIDSKYSEALYQLRNSLLHSFGLFTVARNKKKFNFILHQAGGVLVATNDDLNYYVSVHLLREVFESAVVKFRDDIEKQSELQNHFVKMYPLYGCIGMKSEME